jgi:gliding motility-associated-like protein
MVRGFCALLLIFLSTINIVLAQAPTSHSSGISITNVYCHYFDAAWSPGNGTNRLVLAKEGSATNQLPADYIAYNANDSFGRGSQLGSGNFAVYSGTGNSFTLRNLKKNTTYYISIFEFNITSGDYEYYTESSYATANKKTENIISDFSIDKTFQCLSGNQFNFTNKSSNSQSNGMTYFWEFGDKITTTATDPSHVYGKGAIFRVVLQATSTGCVTTTTIQDTVGVPFITFFELDTTIKGNDSFQCFKNNQFNLLNKFKVPPPIYGTWDRTQNYWSTSDGQSGRAQNYDFIAKGFGKVKVKLIQSRQVSKGAEYCIDSFEREFYILPPPLKSSDVKFSDTLLCLNEGDFTFTHTGTDVVTTLWDFGDGSTSNGNPANYAYAAIGRYRVLLEVTDSYGCKVDYVDTVEVVTTPINFFTGLKKIYCLDEPVSKLIPNLYGGQFKGGNVSSFDSTFNPNVVGQYKVSYIYQVGNCIDTFSEDTEVLDRPSFSLGNDTIICANTEITLDIGVDNLTYLWNTGSQTRSIIIDQAGIYWANASNGFCDFRDTVNIDARVLPTLELGSDTTICGGQVISFRIKSDDGTIFWSDGNTSFNRDISETGDYQVVINHPCGTLNDEISVEILPYACEMFVPNIFSPNGDVLNELFGPVGLFVFTDMQVFNEYGMKLYETLDPTKGWDGTYEGVNCQQGMYYYLIRYQLPENGSQVKKIAKGSVYLIR